MKLIKLPIHILLFLALYICLGFFSRAEAATEFVSVVDPGNGTGTDYTSLTDWNTGVVTDLTAATTKVFAGSKTGAVGDNASVTGHSSSATATVVHATATQILLENISGTFQNGEQIWVDSSNYFTTSNTGDSAIAIAKCRTTNGAADTTAVTIGSNWTTSATNYIKIWTDPEENYRHQGEWDTSRYNLVASTYGHVMQINENYVRLDGLQLQHNYQYGSGIIGTDNAMAGAAELQISNSILRGHVNGLSGQAEEIGIDCLRGNNQVTKVWNNIIYDVYHDSSGDNGEQGIAIYGNMNNGSATAYVYNNTVQNCGGTYSSDQQCVSFWGESGTLYLKNNIVQDPQSPSDCYYNDVAGSTANNISDDTSSPDSAYRSKEVVFADEANDDFHLHVNDTEAKDSGTDQVSEIGFTTDIDNSTRTGTWDIGADEAAISIYRSVGPSDTSNLNTGSATVGISGTTATFSTAMPDNIGVGDVLKYSTNQLAFISGRTDATHFNVASASGGQPTAVSAGASVNIYRAYTSLSGAESGNENASIGIDFDTGDRDIVTNNEQWYIACYANGETADETTVMISGWTTSRANYLRIFTPVSSTEVGTTQRHQGKWDTTKYRLEISNTDPIFVNLVKYVRIEGIQIKLTANNIHFGINIGDFPADYSTDIQLSNNIIQGVLSGGATNNWGIDAWQDSVGPSSVFKIWNNIIYGFANGGATNGGGIVCGTQTAYIYNNTIYNSYFGILDAYSASSIFAKNNIVQNTNTGYSGYFDNSSDYNISDHADTPGSPGTHNKNSTTVSFVDATNKDFHLAFTDTSAKGYGVNLANDTYLPIRDDIDGQSRTGTWSIGADEPIETTIQSPYQGREGPTDGLVLYQSFDGDAMDWSNTSAEARDQSGQRNNGDVVGGASAAIGARGQALNFDGGDDYVDITSSIPDIADSATFSVWAYESNAQGVYSPTNQNIFAYGTTYMQRWSDGGGWRFVINNNASYATPFEPDLQPGWHHFVGVWDENLSSDQIKFYIDGILEQTNTATISSITGGSLRIGCYEAGSLCFKGQIDEVRIYDRALSPEEIGDLYRLGGMTTNMSQTDKVTDSLVGMWSFDGADISGVNAYDRSGQNNNGTITGAVPVVGKRGQALNFNGTSNSINLGQQNSLKNLNAPMTVSAWIKYDSLPAGCNTIIGKSYHWQVGIASNQKIRFKRWAAYQSFDSSTSLVAGQWYHTAFTLSSDPSNNLIFYLNGSSNGTGNVTTPLNVGNNDTKISGYIQSDIDYFDGSIDEVRLYSRVLSPDEIDDLYNLGTVNIKR